MAGSSSLFTSVFGKAFSFTLRGMTVTFGSTIISCYAACQIEQGANRLLYKYMPHKFANVDHANGLTQEQLDAVKILYRDTSMIASEGEEYSEQHRRSEDSTKLVAEVLNTAAQEDRRRHGEEHEQATYQSKKQQRHQEKENTASRSIKTRFWTEQPRDDIPIPSALSFALPPQEILACAMTG